MRPTYFPCVLLVIACLAACADPEEGFTDAGVDLLQDVAGEPGQMWLDTGMKYDVDKVDRKLYAHDETQLFVVEPASLAGGTPQLIVVGDFSFDASIPETEQAINDIAVTTDEELYAVSRTFLYRVDTETAKLTKIAVITAAELPPPQSSLTFEKSGALLSSDKEGSLYSIDLGSGAVTKIGEFGSGQGASGDLVATSAGTLYATTDSGFGATKEDNALVEVDPTTGAASPIGQIGYGRVWGLAYWAGIVYGFTRDGQLLEIDPATGNGTMLRQDAYNYWGAAVSPLAPIE